MVIEGARARLGGGIHDRDRHAQRCAGATHRGLLHLYARGQGDRRRAARGDAEQARSIQPCAISSSGWSADLNEEKTMETPRQRIVIGMIDGFGTDYVMAQPMPALKQMMRTGLHCDVKAIMPTVTNVNNVSISCSALPFEHGLTGNSYYNEQTGEADYMESADFLLRPTISERAARHGVKSASAHLQEARPSTCSPRVPTSPSLPRRRRPNSWSATAAARHLQPRDQLLAMEGRGRSAENPPRHRRALRPYHRLSRCICGRRTAKSPRSTCARLTS